jgi:hypothetical protein
MSLPFETHIGLDDSGVIFSRNIILEEALSTILASFSVSKLHGQFGNGGTHLD